MTESIDAVYYDDSNFQIAVVALTLILRAPNWTFEPHRTSSDTYRHLKVMRGDDVTDLKDSNTLQNLKDAFAGESQANRRYLYFAAKADVEGENDVAAVFRSTAEGETGHAHGHLEYMEAVGDPATGLPIGSTSDNLKSRNRRRNPRVHGHVSRYGQNGSG